MIDTVDPLRSARSLAEISLTLLFTRHTGLCDWDRIGSMDRELAIYRRMATLLRRVNLVTYGGRRDHRYAGAIAPLHLLPLPRGLPSPISQRLLAYIHAAALTRTDVIKTNQVAGAEVGRWIKQRFGKPLIVRCGYLYSRFMAEQSGDSYRSRRAFIKEHAAFMEADAVVVTSERDRVWAIEHHALAPHKIRVVPNYVDTTVFRPIADKRATYDICCLARSAPQKNLDTLLDAMALLKRGGRQFSALLIGSAAGNKTLRDRATALDLDLTYRMRVPNEDLPEIYAQCQIFVLPSLYEGHPKALIEAMSCGLPCIGTNVEGIREDLRHLDSGYLCDTNTVSLAAALDTLLDDRELQRALGNSARSYVQASYNIEKVLELELALLQSLG